MYHIVLYYLMQCLFLLRQANAWYIGIGFGFTLEPACLNKAVCSLSVRFHFDILGLCQDIKKFG